MAKEIISTTKAPAAIGPYCQAVKANGFIFVSGQIAIDPKTGEFLKGSIAEKTDLILSNIKGLLEDSGSCITKCVRVGIFLTDMKDFAEMNEVYKKYFGENLSARATVAVAGLPAGENIEIEVTALA
ncbi:MAG: Rid family detoxifying hydrolase [Defluviitaleaceae bacterium]|nr:Rid family detoxifying hydrolase [Defluviitaleaceae bacterium]